MERSSSPGSSTRLRRALLIALIFALLFIDVGTAFVTLQHDALGAAEITTTSGITVVVRPDGHYSVTSRTLSWTFGGATGQPLARADVRAGADGIGPYREIVFDYQAHGPRQSSIRAYENQPDVLFSTTYLTAAPNSDGFPHLTSYPAVPYHLSYADKGFAPKQWNWQGTQGPLLGLDGQHRAFLLSPASHELSARLAANADGSITSGIVPAIHTLPANFTQRTLLVAGTSINGVYATWGHALLALAGKRPTDPEGDVTLRTLGYWTDNGAAYYYRFSQSLGYAGTLLAIQRELAARGVTLGYMQLDSWWYPKSPNDSWQGDTHAYQRGGEYTYSAATDIFPGGLAAFQRQLGLPLVVHARWIDASSPLRQQYTTSDNVITDPAFWQTTMAYLQSSGVVTFEQDWLGGPAKAQQNLSDPYAFFGNMASQAAAHGLTIQYCTATPNDFLQSTSYPALTTIRVSSDRFRRSHWDDFLYTSRLASALGLLPFSDVFMSDESVNLLLATLSAGMVGIGDPLGATNTHNLLQAVRPDGVIVKPDAPVVPIDATYLADAQQLNAPMVAASYSDHTGLREAYVVAYQRHGGHGDIGFSPNALGVAGDAYVYNYFTDTGTLVPAGQSFRDATDPDTAYYIVAPVGPSGIALLGDAGKFVAASRQRITALADDGVIHATLSFAAGERAVTLYGYAPSAPRVSVTQGSAGRVRYDPATHVFRVSVSPGADLTAALTLSLSS
ncbi:MAG TPA: hypothetical protein VFU88_06410 [Ktedonobacterales bacterium]|nr:hypothetical protein [Ktedonobacterales bacterium]